MRKILILFILLLSVLTACTNEGLDNNPQQFIQLKNLSVVSTREYIAESEQRDVLTEHDIVLINDLAQKEIALTNYSNEYQEELRKLIDSTIEKQQSYFDLKSIAIVPFIYSSSETNIELKLLEFDIGANTFCVSFELYSPELLDMDLMVKFYLVEIQKDELKGVQLETVKGIVTVFNTRNETNHSLYYGKEESNNRQDENKNINQNDETGGAKKTRMLKINTFFASKELTLEENSVKLSEQDITFVHDKFDKEIVLNGYSAEFKEEISNMIDAITSEQEDYFDSKSLLIVPFIYSSSETDIILREVKIAENADTFCVSFELYSPEFADMDLLVKFYVVEILKTELQHVQLDSFRGVVAVFNTRNKTNKSVHYGGEKHD